MRAWLDFNDVFFSGTSLRAIGAESLQDWGQIASGFDVLSVLIRIFYRQASKLGDRAIFDRSPIVDTKIDGS